MTRIDTKVFLLVVMIATLSLVTSACNDDKNECKEGETKCDGEYGYHCVWDEDEEIWMWSWYDCLLGCTEDGNDCRIDNCKQGAYQCANDGVTLQRCNAFLFEEKFPNAINSDDWKDQIGKPTSGVGYWVDIEKCHSGCSNNKCNFDIYENDTNNNHMIDQYETAKDQGKSCLFYSDCSDFCDSLIGHKCSTRCTSNDQCVSDKYICRPDGRCASRYFESIWSVEKYNYYSKAVLIIPIDENNIVSDSPCDITIDWGDGTAINHYNVCNGPFKHIYGESSEFHVKVDGILRGFTLRNDRSLQNLIRIESFGLLQLAHDAFDDSTENTTDYIDIELSNDAFPSDSIPDATLLTNMSYMFGDYCNHKRNPNIERWDTHYVTDMSGTFLGACSLSSSWDIAQWDTSNVENMRKMFAHNSDFNSDIRKWDTSKVKNMDSIFLGASKFNYDLSSWDLTSVESCVGAFTYSGLSEENKERMTNWFEKCEGL